MEPITTTLNAIRKHSPCEGGWEKLLKHLGKTKPDDEPLRFSTILESNGVNYAFRCLRALPREHDGTVRLLLCDLAERALPIYEQAYPHDRNPRNAIYVARRYAKGDATEKELDAAWAATWAAATEGTAALKAQGELLVKYFG